MFENAEICRRRIRISVVLSIVVAISSLGVGSANADGTMVSSDSTRTLKVAVPTAADEASGVLPPRLTSKVVGVLGSNGGIEGYCDRGTRSRLFTDDLAVFAQEGTISLYPLDGSAHSAPLSTIPVSFEIVDLELMGPILAVSIGQYGVILYDLVDAEAPRYVGEA